MNGRSFVSGTAKQKEIRQRIKEIVNDDNFIMQLNKCLAILKPIDQFIVKFQSDNCPISEVYSAFKSLPLKIQQIYGLKPAEVTYLISLRNS